MKYATKAEWAFAKAAEIERNAYRVGGEARGARSWRDARTRRENASRLLSEATRFRRMADRFAAAGI